MGRSTFALITPFFNKIDLALCTVEPEGLTANEHLIYNAKIRVPIH